VNALNDNTPTPTLLVVEVTLFSQHEVEAVLDDLNHHRAVLSVKVISE